LPKLRPAVETTQTFIALPACKCAIATRVISHTLLIWLHTLPLHPKQSHVGIKEILAQQIAQHRINRSSSIASLPPTLLMIRFLIRSIRKGLTQIYGSIPCFYRVPSVLCVSLQKHMIVRVWKTRTQHEFLRTNCMLAWHLIRAVNNLYEACAHKLDKPWTSHLS
jgi:hypothetical protein